MIDDITAIARAMTNTLRNLHEEGFAEPDANGELLWEHVFPFPPSDVAGIHTYKRGSGDGVWFRLRDGRVFSRFGEVADADPALYHTVAN
jgi:hypothetical protein